MFMRILSTTLMMVTILVGCAARPGEPVPRYDDEIVAAGQRFRIGTPVVLWTDPGGYDAYRVERRFVTKEQAPWSASKEKLDSPNRYGLRYARAWDDGDFEQLRGGGWDLGLLQDTVDQFVIHYDVCGTSRQCFNILHDHRNLSVHFMLDLDGTIYQTLDLKERAWHAGTANDRSIGIEIANMGAYPLDDAGTLAEWYETEPDGRTRVTLPARMGDGGIRTPGFIARPARDQPVVGEINGRELVQYDLTAEQYAALIRLTAALSRIFPNIELVAPRDADGNVANHVLSDDELAAFKGVIGHYHLTENKSDPGPAFQWDMVLDEAERLR